MRIFYKEKKTSEYFVRRIYELIVDLAKRLWINENIVEFKKIQDIPMHSLMILSFNFREVYEAKHFLLHFIEECIR